MFRKAILSTVTVAIIATSAVSAFTNVASAQNRVRATASTILPAIKKAAVVNKSTQAPTVSFLIDNSMKAKLNTMQWTMAASKDGRPILSGNQYRLVNAVSQSGLKRQSRTLAANLGWLSPSSKEFNIRIKRQAGDGQVRYGDVVALEVKSYGWLRYKSQSHGINLSDDNNNPHYMWVITGGTKGTKLVSGMPFALYNTRMKTEMTYCTRTWGIDLGWHGKSKCDTNFAKLSGKVFGKNGLFARDGLTGKAGGLLKDHICEVAVNAAVAAVVGTSGGTAGLVAATGSKFAIDECKKL